MKRTAFCLDDPVFERHEKLRGTQTQFRSEDFNNNSLTDASPFRCVMTYFVYTTKWLLHCFYVFTFRQLSFSQVLHSIELHKYLNKLL